MRYLWPKLTTSAIKFKLENLVGFYLNTQNSSDFHDFSTAYSDSDSPYLVKRKFLGYSGHLFSQNLYF